MIAILMMLLFCVNIEIFLEKPVLPWKTEDGTPPLVAPQR
jgi:hypothetical protein